MMLTVVTFVVCDILALTCPKITDGTELVIAFLFLSKRLVELSHDQRAGNYLAQRISIMPSKVAMLQAFCAHYRGMTVYMDNIDFVHRHGDRTPTYSSLDYSTDREALVRLSQPYGYGQLTNKGKRRAYQLGKFIRNHYNELLGSQYNSSRVFIQSTDLSRTKMTILAALAAIYPPGVNNWSEQINWTPVPYTTIPVKYDWNIAYLNCPKFINGSNIAMDTYYPEFTQYKKALEAETRATKQNIVQNPVQSFSVNDVFDVQRSFGLPLPDYIEKVLPEVQAAAALALDIIFDRDNAALEAGVLLDRFLHYSSLAVSGIDTERIRIYSAHDYNVYAFEIVTQAAPRQGVPKYCSVYSLELRRVTSTGQFIVVPVYLPQPGQEVIFLEIEGCGHPCYYDKFVQLTKKKALSYKEWHNECGFYDDFVVNFSE